MTLDVITAQLTCSFILAAVTLYLALTTAIQHDTRAGRIISIAFLTTTCTGVLTAILNHSGERHTMVGALASGGIVLGFGLVRSGLRLQQHGSAPGLGYAFGTALLTLLSGTLGLRPFDLPLALVLSVVFVAGFAAACVTDARRGPLAGRPSVRVLRTVMALLATAIVLTIVLFLAGLVTWSAEVDIVIALGVAIAFTVVALCVSSLRVEASRLTWWGDGDRASTAAYDVADIAQFRRDARDRIARSSDAGAAIGLIRVEIEHLDDMVTAFGLNVRDRAVIHVGTVVRTHVPPFALIGHLGDGCFLVLTSARAQRPVERVASAIRNGLALRHVELPVAVTCAVGWAMEGPDDVDLDLDRMIATAHATGARHEAS